MNIRYLLVTIGLVIISVIITFLWSTNKLKKIHEIELRNAYDIGLLDTQPDQILITKDRNGQPMYKALEQNSMVLAKENKKMHDSLIKVIGDNNKDISKIVTISATTDNSHATGVPKTKPIKEDSLWNNYYSRIPRTYSYKDPFYEYEAIASDSLRFNVNRMNDSLYLIYSKTKLKDKNYVTATIKNNNPKVTYTGIKSISYNEATREPSRWGIGVMGGVGYNPTSKKPVPVVGIGITYDIITFKKKIK